MLADIKPSKPNNKDTEDAYLREAKRAYQAEGLAKIKAGLVAEQSHHLFGLRNAVFWHGYSFSFVTG